MKKKIADKLKEIYVTRTSGYLDVSDKTLMFKEISEHFGGEFSIGHDAGNVYTVFKIIVPYKNRRIIMTESDTRPLKFQIGFEPQFNYQLVICLEDFIDKFLKKLGVSEVEIGDSIFDNQYLIHSNDASVTRKLLNEKIRNRIMKYNFYHISYESEHNANKSELKSVISRTIDDKESYKDLIILHQEIIEGLSELRITR